MEKDELGEFVMPLAKAFAKLQQATALIAQKGLKDPEEAGAAASDYLRLFGLVALGWSWLTMVEKAQARLEAGEGNAAFYEAKIKTARFYMTKLLPQTNSLFITIAAGAKPLMELEEAAF